MARRPLTDREHQIRDARAKLAAERRVLREGQARLQGQRQRVQDAQLVLDALSRCDWCGTKTMATGSRPQLCWTCSRQRSEQKRVELLRRHGYDAKGRRLPRGAEAQASAAALSSVAS
jgi:hypothetical protein